MEREKMTEVVHMYYAEAIIDLQKCRASAINRQTTSHGDAARTTILHLHPYEESCANKEHELYEADGPILKPVDIAAIIAYRGVRVNRPRLKTCVERWPECNDGEFNPACCRFPKSCSCTIYDEGEVGPGDLEE